MSSTRRPGWLLGGIAAAALAAFAAALYTQHGLGMQPCPWCVLQRLIAVLIGMLALLGLGLHLLRLTALRAALAAAVGVMALGGVAAALWQHFVAAQSASCAMTLADRLIGATGLDARWPQVFAAYASCADAKVDLLGVPYEFWSMALFIGCAAAAAVALRGTRR